MPHTGPKFVSCSCIRSPIRDTAAYYRASHKLTYTNCHCFWTANVNEVQYSILDKQFQPRTTSGSNSTWDWDGAGRTNLDLDVLGSMLLLIYSQYIFEECPSRYRPRSYLIVFLWSFFKSLLIMTFPTYYLFKIT